MGLFGSIRSFFRRGEQRSAGLGVGAVPSSPVLSGTYVTPQTALALTAVYAAINVISRDIATLPLGLYEKLPNGGLKLDESSELSEILKVAFNEEVDSFRGRQHSMGHCLGNGNGYLEIVRNKGANGDGSVSALQLLHPVKTKLKRTVGAKLFYELENGKTLMPEDVLHLAGLGFNGVSGYCCITICRQSIGTGIATEQFGASFFGNGAIARGILKLAKHLKTAALNNLRASINQVHQGSQSAHQFMILEEGMTWENTQISPDDAQFIESRKFTVVEIARLFSVPPHKLGDYSEAHMANVEEANLDYFVTTICGWVAMLEAQYNWKLLTRNDRKKYVIMHDFSALMRGNTAARTAYYQGLRNLGAINADEIRLLERLNPIGPEKGGDKYLVQMQYTTLENAGKAPEPLSAKRFVEIIEASRKDASPNHE